MGYEYRILKPADKTWFDMGKGKFTKPMEEFAKWDSDAIHGAETSTEMLLAHKGVFTRSMMAKDKQEFVDLYIEGLRDMYEENLGNDYLVQLGGKLWDWFGEDEVWIYGDHAFEVYERDEWSLTGSRYVEKCDKCHKSLERIFELQEDKYSRRNYCEEHYHAVKKMLDSGLLPYTKSVRHFIKSGALKKPKHAHPGSDGSTDYFQRLKEAGWEERQWNTVKDATLLYKNNKECTVFVHPSAGSILFEYRLTVYVTQEEMVEIKRLEEEHSRKIEEHNRRCDEDSSYSNFRYVVVPTFEITSKPAVSWGEMKLKRFDIMAKYQERARDEIARAEKEAHTNIFIDGIEQK